MTWCVYYADGSKFSSEDGSPEEAPLDGVQVILEHRDGQPHYHWGADFYFWTGDSWQAGYSADFERWVRSLTKRIKYGLVMSQAGFNRYLEIMKNHGGSGR